MGNACKLENLRFGRLLVLERSGSDKRGNALWKCVCDCGNTHTVSTRDLKDFNTQSCGCLWGEVKITHGQSNSPTYYSWDGAKRRCFYRKDPFYHRYGGRGITVCNRWLGKNGFSNFLQDMGDRPRGKTLDRYPDNDGNYEPSNCRWATPSQQANNRRRNGER